MTLVFLKISPLSFNSIKVRLKPAEDAKANYAAKFQFHKGPIKAGRQWVCPPAAGNVSIP